jgi:hypothetical protein
MPGSSNGQKKDSRGSSPPPPPPQRRKTVSFDPDAKTKDGEKNPPKERHSDGKMIHPKKK